MAMRFSKIVVPLLLLTFSGALLGYVGEAAAIDRQSFDGHPVGDARPGYGAERSSGTERLGYASERQRYGAETLRSSLRRSFRSGGYIDDGSRFQKKGSFIRFDDRPGFGRDRAAGFVSPFIVDDARSGIHPDFSPSMVGSFIYLDDSRRDDADTSGVVFESSPKIIDVTRDSRLDALLRRPASKEGVEVIYAGGTKIIRISSVSADADAGQAESRRAPLEPWSEGWRRYCTRTHSGFDSNRGTFTADNGTTRFCTGE